VAARSQALDGGGEGPAPADPDPLPVDQQRIEHGSRRLADHALLIIVVVDRGHDGRVHKAEMRLQPLLEGDATGERQPDIDMHRAVGARLADDLVDPQPRDAELVGDFLLGQPSHIVIPGDARAHMLGSGIVVSLPNVSLRHLRPHAKAGLRIWIERLTASRTEASSRSNG